jgi:hypothetical protein
MLSPEQATPRIRTWVLTEGDKLAKSAQENTLNGAALLLSWRILKESSHVFIEDDPDNNEYDTDLSIFELCCYYLFHVDVWLLTEKQEQFREMVFQPLVMLYCVSTIAKFLKNDSLKDVLENRLQFYSALTRTQSDPGKLVESLNEYFQQMIYMDFFKNFSLKAHIKEFVTKHFRALTESIYPIIQKMLNRGLIQDNLAVTNESKKGLFEQGKEYCARCNKTVRATFQGCCPDCGEFL